MGVLMSSQALSRGEKPARPAVRLRYATFEARVVAGILDLLVLFIIGAAFVIVGALIILISSDFEKVDPSSTAINAFWGCVVAIPVAYVIYFLLAWGWKGQTVGQSVMQVLVVRSDGRNLGILGAIVRVLGLLVYVLVLAAGGVAAWAVRESTFLAAVAIFVAFLLAAAGILWAAFDRRRRTVHDRLAGTIVVRIS